MNYSVNIQVVRDDGPEYYVARHPELLGVLAHGATPEDAVAELALVREEYLEDMKEAGITPPSPHVFVAINGEVKDPLLAKPIVDDAILIQG